VLFLFSLGLLEWACIAYCISHITLLILHYNDNFFDLDSSFREAFRKFPSTCVVVFLCLLVAGFVTKLFLYHLKIIC